MFELGDLREAAAADRQEFAEAVGQDTRDVARSRACAHVQRAPKPGSQQELVNGRPDYGSARLARARIRKPADCSAARRSSTA